MTIIEQDTERGGGAVSVPMAVAVLALFASIGLGIDGARAAQSLAHADAVAEEAARAAGQALDVTAVRYGVVELDRPGAVEAARRHLTLSGVDGDIAVVGPQRIRVRSRVTRPTVLLGLIGQSTITVDGSAEATLVPLPAGGQR